MLRETIHFNRNGIITTSRNGFPRIGRKQEIRVHYLFVDVTILFERKRAAK